MAKLIVKNSGPLHGEVKISGSKNAVLPILAATLLTEEECIIQDAPALRDVEVMNQLLMSLGAKVESDLDNNIVKVKAEGEISCEAPFELVKMMRASILVLGALLLRSGRALIHLLRRMRNEPGVKHIFINSGIRLDLALMQPDLTAEIIRHHVSGHMKVAPEHLHPRVLALMRKGKSGELEEFMKIFERVSRECGKEQYLIPLFISNFPGCTAQEMKVVDDFLASHHWSPQQAQDYIPLPLTMGAAMYYSGKTASGEVIEVNRGLKERRTQLTMLKHRRDGGPDRGRFDPQKRGNPHFHPKGGKKFPKR